MAKADLEPDLLKQAEELNIEVTDAATNETLKAAIDEVLAEDGAKQRADVVATLRAAYKAATGKSAFNGWDAAELQKRIDAAGGQPAVPAAKAPKPAGKPETAASRGIPVLVNRDYWDVGGNRIRKGSVVEVSVEDALDGVESGALSRVK